MLTTIRVAVASVAILAAASAASAQQAAVTQADIQRLQDNVYLADRDVSQLRNRDSARASQLQTQLDDLRDEVVYLKVKLRKERTLTRSEYGDVRDRIESVRSSARGEPPTLAGVPSTTSQPSASQPSTSSSQPSTSSSSSPSTTSRSTTSASSSGSNSTGEV